MARKAAELELALKDLELAGQRVGQEVEAVRGHAALEEAKHEEERRRTLAALQVEEERSKAEAARGERELALLKARRVVENDISEAYVKARLIERLPEVAAALKPGELRAVSVSSADGCAGPLLGFLAGALGLAEDALKTRVPSNGTAS
jgi:hypothetical protein